MYRCVASADAVPVERWRRWKLGALPDLRVAKQIPLNLIGLSRKQEEEEENK